MNRSNSYVQLSLLSVTVLLFGMFVFSNVYAETVSITTQISPITILFDEFISLLDTSVTGNLTSVSVTANLPCDSSNTPLLTIVAGILGDTTNIIDSSSDFIGNGPRDTCVFRDNITNVTAANIPAINSVFLNHTGSSPVHIPQGVMVTLSGVFGNSTSESTTSEPISSGIVATGGTITTNATSGKTIHTFTSSGTFQVTSGSGDVEYLVIGGGGGGGEQQAGGGGAGGYLTATGHAVTAQGYSITIGGGGAGATTGSVKGINGGDSIFDTLTAIGGGGAGSSSSGAGSIGGSGGGGSNGSNGGAGTIGQGFAGGFGFEPAGYGAGGGGGASEVGQDGTGSKGGDGGDGLSSSITGTAITRAAGGGGGTYVGGGGATQGLGGLGGGGDGGGSTTEHGDTNTGSGGGGGWNNSGTPDGGDGGSGIVIISYDTP